MSRGADSRRGRGTPLPPALASDVAAAWSEVLRRRTVIASASGVAGGCISATARLESAEGDVAFLKWGADERSRRMFAAEAVSLRAIAESGAVRVPAVLAESGATSARDPEAGQPAWLLLEWLEAGGASRAAWRGVGGGLARLHQVRDARFGWRSDNFIGSLPQANPRTAAWASFWREARLEPQVRRARDGGRLDGRLRARFDALFRDLDALLLAGQEEGPVLLHGDLWSGNVHMLGAGAAALIDPSCSFGHREVDLAMTELFGGFDAAFYEAYREAFPTRAGYAETRRPIYQLYYLLVHLNLFGGGYLGAVGAALERAGF